MALVCAISNEVPEEPVVSPASGAVFERRLITKFIQENGQDPITNTPLTEDQLILLKVAPVVKPRPPSATSIPAILKALQDEWDAVMLHSFSLRQQLQTARQELSHALYQHDAACRVIARLTKEVTAAREALATLKPQAGVAAVSVGGVTAGALPMDTTPTPAATPVSAAATPIEALAGTTQEEIGMTPQIIDNLQNKAALLTAERKQRGKNVPDDLVKADSIRQYRTVSSHPGLHSASIPGILCMDVCPTDSTRILTGGNDKNAVLFNKDTEQVIAVLKGHTKKVTSVIYHPEGDLVITASPDTSVRVWHTGTAQTTRLLRPHGDAAVQSLSLHATGDYLLSTSTNDQWAFSDLRQGRVVTTAGDGGAPLTCSQFHPDGLIFGTGTQDSLIKIWDLKERTNVANFPGHSGPVAAVAFSENGYYLATAADDSTVKLWDLRKLKNFKTLPLDEGYEVRSLTFDASGTYLAVAGTDVRVYLCKQWDLLRAFGDHTALATDVRFGHRARYIASVSMDRTLKIYASE